MLSIEGKRSFLAFYWSARRFLGNRLEKWFENETIMSNEYIGDANYLKNVKLVAQCICHKLVEDQGGIVEILTPSGALPRIPFYQLDGSFQAEVRRTSIAGLGGFSIGNFAGSGWQRPFFYEKLLIEAQYAIFDWEYCTVDVSVLQLAASNAARGRAERGSTEIGPILDRGLLALLRPYHGCPVVVPSDWLNVFNQEEFEETSKPYLGNPSQRILEYFRGNPAATKAEIKARLFPETSHRKFQLYYSIASESEPALSRPGRPKGT